MLRRTSLALALGSALLLVGCGPTSTRSTGAGSVSPSARVEACASAVASPTTAGASPTTAVSDDAIPSHYDATRDPVADLKSALGRAAADGKEVLVDFGADWCPDCRVLDELYQVPSTRALLQRNYHVIAVDVGRFDRNLAFTARYVDLRTSGIPALVVLTPGGTVRTATNDGSFANARTMTTAQLEAFLTRWARGS